MKRDNTLTRSKLEKRFFALFRNHAPWRCAQIIADEERQVWIDILKAHEKDNTMTTTGMACVSIREAIREAYEKMRGIGNDS